MNTMNFFTCARLAPLLRCDAAQNTYLFANFTGDHPLFEFLPWAATCCLKPNLSCDGVSNCPDGSDENDCDYLSCKPKDWFKCDNGMCISGSLFCDKNDDCGDGSDEKPNCQYNHHWPSEEHACLVGQFKCHDGVCISDSLVCNSKPDCPDASDEKQNCNSINCDGFRCKSGQCIVREHRCDGSTDCTDGTDEVDCPSSSRPNVSMGECLIERGFYACQDKVTCIKVSALCDNEPDCLNADDEGPLCKQDQCKSSECNQLCHSSPQGAVCSCKPGFTLKKNSSSICEDANECDIYGSCGQRCHNYIGGFGCSCDDGYVMAGDNKTCVAEEGDEAILSYANGREIRSYSLSTKHLRPMLQSRRPVAAFAFDGLYIYWSSLEDGQEMIKRNRTGSAREEEIVSSGLVKPEHLAFDWVARNLYFTDSGTKTVSACTADGHWCSVVVNTVIDMPHSLVLVPQQGEMFWTDWGKKPHIASAGMDGSKPGMFLELEVDAYPNSLAMDYGNGRLYWADAKSHIMQSVKLDGTDRRVVLEMYAAYSIAIFESRLFWSDVSGSKIRSCDKFTGMNLNTIVRDSRDNIGNIFIYHPALQPFLRNPCLTSECSHMCLLAPKGRYGCACPSNLLLGQDQITCEEGTKYSAMLIAAGDKIIRVEHQILGRLNISYVELQDIDDISALAYNSKTNSAIIADSGNKRIVSFGLRKAHLTVLIDMQLGYVSDMEFDYIGNNLYWCDSERQVIEIFSFNTLERMVLVRDFDGTFPVSLALIPDEGKMFVGLSSQHHNHVDMVSMDGQGVTHAIENLFGAPTALTVHTGLHRVFWIDEGTGLFESTDNDALDKHVWRFEVSDPVSMAGLGQHMFWTSKNSKYLHWADVHDAQTKITRIKLIEVKRGSLMHLAAITPHPDSKHACRMENGGCSHICLAITTGAKCGCPIGMRLKSDGLNCIAPATCSEKEFKCEQDDVCIPMKMRCDGHTNCLDGEDEKNCERARNPFICKNGECVQTHQKCNETKDCAKSTCRRNKTEMTSESTATEFACLSGECIPLTLLCDGVPDCSDGSDEADCSNFSCLAGYFNCGDGACVPKTWVCDGHLDCKDGSDEYCGRAKCLPRDFHCKSGECLDQSLKCDGQNDCEDGSDEECAEEEFRNADECDIDMFKCVSVTKIKSKSLICLPRISRCNGTKECPFGDDETDCGCRDDLYECTGSHKCIIKSWVCDGRKDCLDGEDEAECFAPTSTTQPASTIPYVCDQFRCGSGECLRFDLVCDGKQNCIDRSDEGGKCHKCCRVDENSCSQVCNPTPLGARCSCKPGFVLSGDGLSCEDVDECKSEPDVCSHFCTNTPGSFICSCAPDYVLQFDRRSCKAISRSLDVVFVTNDEIRKVSLNSRRRDVLTSHTGLTVSGLAVDAHLHHVYWSTATTGKLTRMSEANEIEKQIERVVQNPRRLAVDWISANVFVVDQLNRPTIKVCSVRLGKCSKLATAADADEVTAIALDPASGFMFWTQISANGSEVWRANMDGENATSIVKFGLSAVSGLTLDLVKKRVFWSDKEKGTIEQADYQGSSRNLLNLSSVNKPAGIATFEDEIYWMEGDSGKLRKCGLRYPFACRHVELLTGDTAYFQLIHEALQPTVDNKCEEIDCGTGICVPVPSGVTCLCRKGNDCQKIKLLKKREDEGNGGTIALVFLTLGVVVVVGCYIWHRKQKQEERKIFDFGSLHFVNSAFGQNAISSKIVSFSTAFDKHKLHFSNPFFNNRKPAGPDAEKCVQIVTPPVAARRTIPVDALNSPSTTSNDSSHSSFEPETTSLHASLIRTED
ncbi:Hypothetical predicted protein [Cloeon dipterum]|uniref:EGF-like domain-containing protein n=1 Tax=Cloeon dipterum TaxID=197152 RepID=A0A8S1CM04_9INSE|nr:Hypothetical predicted protein [Cloeon dipterum]